MVYIYYVSVIILIIVLLISLFIFFSAVFILFWSYQVEKSTYLFQIFDCIDWRIRYHTFDIEKKKALLDLLKDNEVMKKRIGILALISRLEKDVKLTKTK